MTRRASWIEPVRLVASRSSTCRSLRSSAAPKMPEPAWRRRRRWCRARRTPASTTSVRSGDVRDVQLPGPQPLAERVPRGRPAVPGGGGSPRRGRRGRGAARSVSRPMPREVPVMNQVRMPPDWHALSHCVRRFRIDLCCQGMAGELTIGGLARPEAATLRPISAAAEALGYTQSAVSRRSPRPKRRSMPGSSSGSAAGSCRPRRRGPGRARQ